MKIGLSIAGLAALALAAPAFAHGTAAKPLVVAMAMGNAETFTMAAQSGSGENGTVTLTPMGSKTKVAISLTGAPKTAQPAHVHPGTCAKLNPVPKYPLSNVVGGKSTTVLNLPIKSITSGGFAVNVHESAADLAKYVSCGDLTSGNMKMMTKSAGHM
ncbi:MAG: hypothetical protein ACREM2_03280 [Vulcanimicrobiaceae bacterium]